MSWQNVLWVYRRELRDQLRDRRTLFMVAVLPVLMYPLLGASMFQLAQFVRDTTGVVSVYGAEQLDGIEGLPPLVDGDRFDLALFLDPAERGRLVVRTEALAEADAEATARAAIAAGDIEAAVCLPPDFGERLAETREAAQRGAGGEPFEGPPQPIVLSNSAREASQVAGLRVASVVRRWRELVVQGNLAARNVPVVATSPFRVAQVDVAPRESRDALLWSKLLPFVVFLWALTGAFYPAIDLCAGEKERGTLETLLASPARRSEIVGGKLLTVMTFSVFTSLLNLASLALTARVLSAQLTGLTGASVAIAPPAVWAMAWLVVAVLPVAALFSALSIACAAYARSTKEGQYYFMPLFLGALPLMLVPLSPGVELNLPNSLVPVMGLVLLLRGVIEGQLATAAQFAAPVVLSTAVCCWLAMRWAVSQFNQESVLFRESERFDLRGAVRSMFRNRGETPSAGAAVACVVTIFLMQSLVRALTPAPTPGVSGFGYVAATIVAGQLLTILAPALGVAWLLSRDRLGSLLLRRPVSARDTALAVGIAACLHPTGQRLAMGINKAYPLSEAVEGQLRGFLEMFGESPPIGLVLLLMAALPAVCEEVAFRGVILSGLRKTLGPFGGVLMTAALFGATHTVLQQSLAAAPVGVVLGLLALRTGSLVPCVAFHAAYNALQLLSALHAGSIRQVAAGWGLPDAVFTEIGGGQLGYATPIAILGFVAAGVLARGVGRGGRGNPHVAARFEATS